MITGRLTVGVLWRYRRISSTRSFEMGVKTKADV